MCFTPCAACIFQGDDDQSDRAEKSVAVRAILVCMWCCCLHGFSMDPCLIAGVSWNS